MSESANRLNKAIVDKVQKILDNTESIQGLDVYIHGEVGNGVTIRYTVDERVFPLPTGGEKENELS